MAHLKKFFNNIKETILYYIVNWYSNSWYYYNVILMMEDFENDINKSTDIEHAKWLCGRNRFKFVPKSFKRKCIYNKFKEHVKI